MTPKALFAASAMAALPLALEARIPVVLRDLDPSGTELYLTAVTSGSAQEGEAAAGSARA
ncbi:hypothetical protein A5906_32660 [Bradyrhizobium sacchari]|uniref:Uncharacterized protein n=1 Tax=Bradyrhizobium sacchari TaxID=1399419 RepID=A0A560JNX8_9BRAD|nr:hypothetical protein A5906_32660 [Bradyrhizobium sacchari]TWB56897.1 hypothetical protein FBZ94_106156 [Bradyrhizobium sacchari]TWB71174.1 hypothetical protein FBZ95_107156 [Bradyrhizobium sacchari]